VLEALKPLASKAGPTLLSHSKPDIFPGKYLSIDSFAAKLFSYIYESKRARFLGPSTAQQLPNAPPITNLILFINLNQDYR
jgi:hypothetical protein